MNNPVEGLKTFATADSTRCQRRVDLLAIPA
jgi:hypothetical protein